MDQEKKKKKINRMNADEVRQTLSQLKDQDQSHYYLQVAKRAKELGVFVG